MQLLHFLGPGPRFLCSPRERLELRFQRRIGDGCSVVRDRRGRDYRDDLHDLFFCETGVEECIEFLFAEMAPLLDERLRQCGKCGKSLVLGARRSRIAPVSSGLIPCWCASAVWNATA